jgi:hypothetical protein
VAPPLTVTNAGIQAILRVSDCSRRDGPGSAVKCTFFALWRDDEDDRISATRHLCSAAQFNYSFDAL